MREENWDVEDEEVANMGTVSSLAASARVAPTAEVLAAEQAEVSARQNH